MNRVVCAGMLTDTIRNEIEGLTNQVKITSINKIEDLLEIDYEDKNLGKVLLFSSAIKTDRDYDCLRRLIGMDQGFSSCFKFFIFQKDKADIDRLMNRFQIKISNFRVVENIKSSEIIKIMNDELTEETAETKIKNDVDPEEYNPSVRPDESSKRKNPLSRLFLKARNRQEEIIENRQDGIPSRQSERVSYGLVSGIHCVIGHTGVGKTSFLANSAYVVSNEKKRILVLDLDYLTRGLNLFFPQITKNNTSDLRQKALIQVLYNHESVFDMATKINSHLDIIGLSYEVKLQEEELRLLMNTEEIKRCLMDLKAIYDVVMIEISLDKLGDYQALLEYMDEFHLLIENTAYSLYKTSALINMFIEDRESIYQTLRYRCHLVVNKFEEGRKLEQVALTKGNCLKALEHMLVKELVYKSTSKISRQERQVNRSYSQESLTALTVKGYKEYLGAFIGQ